ncbi:hypothetical protein Val02_60640 [Virgisporangium aliadipatigenens]|uniref:FtsX extracellular domain-containing protein n=1 Tax=Virgisporangium aliadipatigenens TaxID=741659 RepID=A0A8J3YSX7_9ACTN|nr:permease-like cell division protein FtsX [Virgisporangium aliadipatigenens]GIJ49178.1 hypothetical protein Val02_60640 [Virgisporangium aliadipatigenens]
MPDLDDRLRAGLIDLDRAARERVRPADSREVAAAGRRRRLAFVTAGAVLVTALAGGLASLWLAPAPGGERGAAPACAPAEATAFLRGDVTPQQSQLVGDTLRDSAKVSSVTHESSEEAYERFKELTRDSPDVVNSVKPDALPESWRFTLACSGDFAAVQAQLVPLSGIDDVVCACEPRRSPSG